MGYDVGRFKDAVNDELICSICTGVLEDPVMAPKCEHSFCRACITEWLQEKQRCPIDNSDLQVEDLCTLPRIVRNMLAKLLIGCNHVSNGCSIFVKLEALESHAKQCKYNPNLTMSQQNNSGTLVGKEEIDKYNSMEELKKRFDALTQNLELEKKRSHEIQENLMKSNLELQQDVNQLKENQEIILNSNKTLNKSNQELKQEVYQLKESLDHTKNEIQKLNQSLKFTMQRDQKARGNENARLKSNEKKLSGEWYEKIPCTFYKTNWIYSTDTSSLGLFLNKYKFPLKDFTNFVLCKCNFNYHNCGIEKLQNFDLIVRRDDYNSAFYNNERPGLILKADNTHVPSNLIPKLGFACSINSTM